MRRIKWQGPFGPLDSQPGWLSAITIAFFVIQKISKKAGLPSQGYYNTSIGP